MLGRTQSMPESTNEFARLGSGYLDIELAVAPARRFKVEGLARVAGTKIISEDRSVARTNLLPRAGLVMESTMTREDEDRPKEEVSEWSPSAEEPIELGIKHLGLQKIYTESGIEGEAAFPETEVEVEEPIGEEPEEIYQGEFENTEAEERYPDMIEVEEPEIEESEEISQGEIEEEEPEEMYDEEEVGIVEEEMDLGERLLAEADRIMASGGRPAKPADFLSRVLSEAGVKVFSDPLGAVRFPAPEVIWKSWKQPASQQWDYIERFLEMMAGPGESWEGRLRPGISWCGWRRESRAWVIWP